MIYGVTRSSGQALDWCLREFVPDSDPKLWLSAFIERESKRKPDREDSPLFLPFLDGERSPIWDPEVMGVFTGLSLRTNRDRLVRSVLEGVAFSVGHNIAVLSESLDGMTFQSLRCGGGAARSSLWNQIKADVAGLTVSVPEESEATCRGAVAVMLTALGEADNPFEAAAELVGKMTQYQPRPDWHEHYAESMDGYRRLAETAPSFFRNLT